MLEICGGFVGLFKFIFLYNVVENKFWCVIVKWWDFGEEFV